jgi:formylglycine-generating enzyme required for sulfatase activity
MAYCRWRGKGFGLMSEAQWNLATLGLETGVENYNLNLKFGSPSPVGMLAANESSGGLFDLRGNVWEWIGDDFYALPGFASHYLYEDNAVPFFNDQHKMMLGGAWITTGTEALRFYRNWFRPYFYQHAGFRIVAPNGG